MTLPNYMGCSLCAGSGIVYTDYGYRVCPHCNGDGEKREKCGACRGRGRVVGMRPRMFGLMGSVRDVLECSACGGSGYSNRIIPRVPLPQTSDAIRAQEILRGA